MKRRNLLYFTLLTLLIILSCNRNNSLIDNPEVFKSEYQDWQISRLERLKSENGWLNLAGLFWLEEGVNTFGSGESNDIIFPKHFPEIGGEIFLEDSTLSIKVHEVVSITTKGEQIDEILLTHDQQKNKTVLEHGSFRWFIIKRGENYGIRLRDLKHPRINELDHIPYYPPSDKWAIEATFVPYDSVRIIEVPTVINNFSEPYKVPGELKFRINGKTHTLLPFTAGKGYFLIVGDASNGIETYGAGRFMYTDKVFEDKVILDFNRAYNPPCAFSPYATCPLPPFENILDLKIEAGEKAIHLE